MTTKYSELSDPMKKELDGIEKFIQGQISASSAIANRNLEEGLGKVVGETEEIQRKLLGLKNLLKRDWHSIEMVKNLVAKELRHSDLIARYIDSVPLGSDMAKGSHHDAYAIYFSNFASDLENRMNQCRQHIEELEMNVKNAGHASRLTPSVIEEIIKAQYSSFMSIASKVAAVHDATTKAKEVFAAYQEKYLVTGGRQTSLALPGKDGYSQMAAYLVPSVPQPQASGFGSSAFGKTGAPGQFGALAQQPIPSISTQASTPFGSKLPGSTAMSGSLLGSNPLQAPASNAFGGSSLFASTLQPKRSNSLGSENVKRPFT
ncbi:Nucleoporin p58/p45 [Kappamyces sp. JEL0829]|nr:Nucleoporin p58/p45 [Kappamyces sp. JEL0829]